MAELQDILQEAMSTVTDLDEGGSRGEDDADSIMFEEGEEDKNISGEELFPSHGDEELQKERDQLRQALQDANREIGHLKSQAAIETEENQKDKEKLRLLNQDLQDRLRKREDELSQAEQTISTNGRALDEATNEVHDLKEKSSSLADELDVEKSKVLNLSKKAAMVEVYRKKLDAIETSDSSGSTEQAENYIEQIMKLESANQKIPLLERDLDEYQTKAKKLESRIQEQLDDLATKDGEISKFKSDAANAEKSKKMFEDELKELRAQQEGAADAAIALNGLSGASEAKLKSDNARLRAQLEQMQQASSFAASVPEGDDDKLSALKKELAAKEDEVSRLVNDKEKLEAYTKKTLQKFQVSCRLSFRPRGNRNDLTPYFPGEVPCRASGLQSQATRKARANRGVGDEECIGEGCSQTRGKASLIRSVRIGIDDDAKQDECQPLKNHACYTRVLVTILALLFILTITGGAPNHVLLAAPVGVALLMHPATRVTLCRLLQADDVVKPMRRNVEHFPSLQNS